MAEALSIDMDEMMAILAETEPEHSHATDDMTIEANVVFNIMDGRGALGPRMSRSVWVSQHQFGM